MKRQWTLAGAVVAIAVVGACGSSGERTEIRTNNGGLLDCRSDTVEYAVFDRSLTAPGSATSADALAVLTEDIIRPPGNPEAESETTAEVVYVFTDEDGNRLGRVGIIRPETGWFVEWAERCG